jgi:hypothetical protein
VDLYRRIRRKEKEGKGTYDVMSWTEGIDFGDVFVGLEALDCNLHVNK